ncbi:hypothetical protein [Streptomyces sp. NBC_00038]|uniref:hypothetical protein n=1 Tax=Streptomyces sp. NBC_00038 TaxID=2903615 RepID=UPI00224D1F0F|nr:hypothetical protein [Streptomyces sp. NBC_00038]MCX5562734.1 hypothetical protein [Streptomyces sp. NBC_00038]MCX5563616.1 hypothetical protein [Streptomyces sp. NBC_00038]
MPKKIEHVPAGKFMTLDEIAQFVADAFAAGANGADVPTGRLSFGGKLQQLVVTVADTDQ